MTTLIDNPITGIRRKFQEVQVSPEWCFKNVRSTEQWTHGYHRYPAKFLPNLVQKLIEEYTKEGDLVGDLFAGCGTTLVEAKIHGRPSIGVDVNPVAVLITEAKTNPLLPGEVERIKISLYNKIDGFDDENYEVINTHPRLDYWFFPSEKRKIAFLYEIVLGITEKKFRDFFLVALSNILKNCSRWLQSSTKPQIDPNKIPSDPFKSFKRQVNQMVKKNLEFYSSLESSGFLNTKCEIKLEDARSTSIEKGTVGAIITSPPYVTSYEYADIHQLTGYWFEYITDLYGFRKDFIGTFYSQNQETTTNSYIGQEIVNALLEKDNRTAKEVANYFNDMTLVGKEMYRVLKNGGHACIVIGNTTLMDVKIKSSEVFAEILTSNGFELVEIIKRSIPYKLIPTIRDKKSGRFSKLDNKNSKLVYPEEYVLIARKKYGYN